MPKSTGRESQFRPKILEIKGKTDFFRVGELNGEVYIVAAVKKHVGGFFIRLECDDLGPDQAVLRSWTRFFTCGER